MTTTEHTSHRADTTAAITTLIRGARLPDGSSADLLLADGLIAAMGSQEARADHTFDADGLLVLPGLVDLHTHLREPGREDSETVATGSAAAARGGFTAVLAMANTEPVTDTAEAALHIAALGRSAGLVEVQPVGAVTRGLAGTELAELGLMSRAAGVTIFSDDGFCVSDARVMRRALEYVRAFDGVVAQHAQDPDLAGEDACCHEGDLSGRLGLPGWPDVAEETIVARDVTLARHTGSRLHVCHVSSAGTVDVLRWAKARGIQVTAEVAPHHLLLTTERLSTYDPTFKVSPPLRPQEHVNALREALADGTIDVVATDHAPHALHDKEHSFVDARPGMVGLEQALGVVVEVMVAGGLLDWTGVSRVLSSRPAEIAKLTGQGRPVAVGEPANLVLVDPSRRHTVERTDTASRSVNNPYHGMDLPDPVVATFYGGRQTYFSGVRA